jgi:hypothetical protein
VFSGQFFNLLQRFGFVEKNGTVLDQAGGYLHILIEFNTEPLGVLLL